MTAPIHRGGAAISAQAVGARGWRRAFAVWVAIALAESLHGVARALWLVPAVGPLRAHHIGVVVACALIFAIAFAAIRWIGAGQFAQQWRIGLAWVAAMLCFEFGLGLALGLPWARIAADYDPRQGGWMLWGMLFLFAAPALAAKARGLG